MSVEVLNTHSCRKKTFTLCVLTFNRNCYVIVQTDLTNALTSGFLVNCNCNAIFAGGKIQSEI